MSNETISSTTPITSTTLSPDPNRKSRPPADSFIKEIIYDKKCGKGETHDAFFAWCSRESNKAVVDDTICEGLRGSTGGGCTFSAEFIKNTTDSSYEGNCSSLARKTIQRIKSDEKPDGFVYYYNCEYGPTKGSYECYDIYWPTWEDSKEPRRLMAFCDQELNGLRSMPLWLILLIIFLVIVAISSATALFWRYWLRRRFYGPEEGDPPSELESRFTSAPISASTATRMPSSSRMASGGGHHSSHPSSARNAGVSKQFTRLTLKHSNPSRASRSKPLHAHRRESGIRATQPSVRSM